MSKKKEKEEEEGPEIKVAIQSGEDFSFWTALKSIIGQISIGADITKLRLPSCFCLPESLIHTVAFKRMHGFEFVRDVTTTEDPLGRMLAVVRWYLPVITDDEFGKKPLNPIQGELFECTSADDDNLHFVGEQISHHPPITAFRLVDKQTGIFYNGTLEVTTSFGGNSLSASWIGGGKLHIGDTDEIYEWNRIYPPLVARGFILGGRRMSLEGDVTITCAKTGMKAVLMYDTVKDKNKEWVRAVEGKIVHGKNTLVTFKGVSGQVVTLSWKKASPLSLSFVKGEVLLDWKTEVKPVELKIKVPEDENLSKMFSNVVWAATNEALKRHDFEAADAAKSVIEEEQRTLRLAREQNKEGLPTPTWFVKAEGNEQSRDWFLRPDFNMD